jgi:hypothetical protein
MEFYQLDGGFAAAGKCKARVAVKSNMKKLTISAICGGAFPSPGIHVENKF